MRINGSNGIGISSLDVDEKNAMNRARAEIDLALPIDLLISAQAGSFSWTWADIAAKLGPDAEQRLSRF
jgi:hypothetical protein